MNGRSANIDPKLLLRRMGTLRLESKVHVNPPAEDPMGNVVVSPSNKPYSAALEFSESAPVAEESSPLNRTVRSASPAL